MRRYLLDTGPRAALLLDRPAAVARLDPLLARGELATSLLVYGEVVEYLKGFGRDHARRRAGLLDLLAAVHPFVLTLRILERYAEVRRAMRRPSGAGLIGDVDTLIAATALQDGLTVVTPDAHFARVPGLAVQRLEIP